MQNTSNLVVKGLYDLIYNVPEILHAVPGARQPRAIGALMGLYLDLYDTLLRAKRDGKSRPPRLAREIRMNIETELAGTRIQTIFDSPPASRIWREFEAACRRLDRAKPPTS